MSYADRILSWAQSGIAREPFTLADVERDLRLKPPQVRPVMRRLAEAGIVDVVSRGNTWVLSSEMPVQTSSTADVEPSGVDYDSPARRIRADGAAARQALREQTYVVLDNFSDGALLLRSEVGKFYRAEITEL